jgi:hypothetical protein
MHLLNSISGIVLNIINVLIKIRWFPLTITPDDTLRRWTYSFLSILQERFHPYSLAAMCSPSYDTFERMLHNIGPIDNNTGLGWSARSVSCILVTWTVTWGWKWFKLCKNETFSLLCDQTSNEIIFKMVDYLQLLVIILMIQWFNLGFNDSILGLIDSILGFNDSILGFNDSILGFNDSILGFNDSI